MHEECTQSYKHRYVDLATRKWQGPSNSDNVLCLEPSAANMPLRDDQIIVVL